MLVGEAWFGSWWSALQEDGTITRLLRRGDGRLLEHAVRILEHLRSRAPGNPIPLPVLAEQVTGGTKALLAAGSLATLVLRALAIRSGLDSMPHDRTGQRALWEMHGAIPDDLASQVLVLNVVCRGSNLVSAWLNDASRSGVPFRLTLQQQTAYDVVPIPGDIFVCENPAVLRVAASDPGTDCPPLVCTEGMPSAACHKLPGSAVAQGARLHWRADFDWTGLRIVGAAITSHRARPWRMTAADYRHALDMGESTPLTGTPTASPWDPELAARLTGYGRAVMEERLIAVLLTDLAHTARPSGFRRARWIRVLARCRHAPTGVPGSALYSQQADSIPSSATVRISSGPAAATADPVAGALRPRPRVDGQDGRPFWPSKPRLAGLVRTG